MYLLLLLSALLSALSGIGQAARGSQAPGLVCAAAAATPASPVRRVIAGLRPAATAPVLSGMIRLVGAAFRLAPQQPIFAGRRRE